MAPSCLFRLAKSPVQIGLRSCKLWATFILLFMNTGVITGKSICLRQDAAAPRFGHSDVVFSLFLVDEHKKLPPVNHQQKWNL